VKVYVALLCVFLFLVEYLCEGLEGVAGLSAPVLHGLILALRGRLSISDTAVFTCWQWWNCRLARGRHGSRAGIMVIVQLV